MDCVAGITIRKVRIRRQPKSYALPFHNLEAAAGHQVGYDLDFFAPGPLGDRSFQFFLTHWVPANNAEQRIADIFVFSDDVSSAPVAA